MLCGIDTATVLDCGFVRTHLVLQAHDAWVLADTSVLHLSRPLTNPDEGVAAGHSWDGDCDVGGATASSTNLQRANMCKMSQIVVKRVCVSKK